jgi:hypothetical protein
MALPSDRALAGENRSMNETIRAQLVARVCGPRLPAARSRRWGVLGAVLLSFAAGCSRGPEFSDVQGVVTLDGKPLDSVEVVFLPDPEKGSNGPRASGYTDAEGRYRLYCEQARQKGTVLGPHRVYIRDITAISKPGRFPGMQAPPGLVPPEAQTAKARVARVPPAYLNPTKTPLQVEVQRGQPTLNFDIKSGQRR